MELRHSLLSGGMNKLTIRKLYKPPQVEKQTNSIDFVEMLCIQRS